MFAASLQTQSNFVSRLLLLQTSLVLSKETSWSLFFRFGTMSGDRTPPISSSAGSVNANTSSGAADPENIVQDDNV
ncbi:hypothetical protein RchiOBHm_Chr1g0371321 [Rosa chinensis]|uniref:Uncharacterized protein n=1 Tax=Rosa chinensis TaxID=74649 RepID=A0A2P6SLJ5_ROSCH|nr:hypothetical protein RchiOBHm_Chr1g0371321 [Rosa chinensis]